MKGLMNNVCWDNDGYDERSCCTRDDDCECMGMTGRTAGQQLLKTARGREKWMRFEHENERSAAMADGN